MISSKRELENQEVLVESLKNQMPIWEPAGWLKDVVAEYIPTSEYDNVTDFGTWTDGVQFVVIDEDTIVWRLSGDWRDDGDWQLGTLEDFRLAVMEDAEETLQRWQDELEDAETE